MIISRTHFVLIPSFNSGARLREVVKQAMQEWAPVLVVVDGSWDRSDVALIDLIESGPGLSVISLPRNSGKGAAVLAGVEWGLREGFTHALTMDSDGQHVASHIRPLMDLSYWNLDAMVLGKPIFPRNVPKERLYGRKLSIGLVHVAMAGGGIADPLFGFRVYPLEPLQRILGPLESGRGFDFDTEAAVRLAWAGVRPLNVPVPVRYFSKQEGGISHFHYLWDNINLTCMHGGLIREGILGKWYRMWGHRKRWRRMPIESEPVRAEYAPARN